jgi:riboflavin synthase
MVPKGSVAIDGVSLTLIEADGGRFSVAVIPTTRAETTLGSIVVGQRVNIEIDILGKYVRRYLRSLLANPTGESNNSSAGLTMDKLKQAGFL